MNHHVFRYLFIAIAALFSLSVNAQPLRINVSLSPQHPKNAGDYFYGAKGPNVLVTVSNTSRSGLEFRLVPTLSSNVRGGFSLTFSPSFFPANFINIAANETKVFTFPLLKAHWGPVSPSDLQASGKPLNEILNNPLEQGFYQYCFVALDVAGGVVSDNFTNCATFQLSDYDAPRLLYPANNAFVKPLQPQFLVFNWSSVGQPMHTRYRFELVDMTENNLANPEDAFRSPAVRKYFEVADLLSPNLPYNMSYPPLQEGRRYAVRIQAYSMPDYPQKFKNNGYSPVTIFTYEEKKFELKQQAGDAGGQTYSPEKILKNKKSPKDDLKKELTGSNKLAKTYKGNDGGAFYVTMQESGSKNNVYWFGEHPDQGYSHIFEGEIKGNLIEGTFWGVPKYGIPTSGKVILEIQQNGKSLAVQSKHVDFIPDVLTSIDLMEYIDLLPLARDYAAYSGEFENGDPLTGLFLGTDGGRYYIRQVGDLIFMIGEARFKKGEQPEFVHLFKGQINPYNTKGYDDYFEGYFTTLSKGTKNASGKSAWRIKSNSRINQYGTSDLGCDTLVRAKTGISSPDGPVPVHKQTDEPDGVDVKPKAEKSAAFVLFYFDDGPFATIFQNIGTKLNLALEGYSKTVVMKEDYLGLKADKEVNFMSRTVFLNELIDLARDGYYIDLYIFTHGSRDGIVLKDGTVTAKDIQTYLGGSFGPGDFPLRMVYQMNCYGSNLLKAFQQVGAKVVSGTRNVNFCPTRYNPFAESWQAGKTFQQAINDGINNDVANSLAATGINANLKWRIGNPLSWDCKSCKVGTDLTDKKNCLGCYYKSFWGFDNSEYDYNQTGLWNMFNSSFHIVVGDGSITKNTKPTW